MRSLGWCFWATGYRSGVNFGDESNEDKDEQ
jgi:hypothetical protein